MKVFHFAFAASLILMALTAIQSASAGDFFSSNIIDDIKAALPNLKFVSGDPSWNGGMTNNGFAQSAGLDTNSSYSVFKSEGGASPLNPQEIAAQVSAVLTGKYHFTLDKDGKWKKSNPPGVREADYAQTYAVAKVYRGTNIVPVHVVLTVQVVRLEKSQFGITVTYIAVGE